MGKTDKLITLAPMTVAEARMLSNAWAVLISAAVGDLSEASMLLMLSVKQIVDEDWLPLAENFTGEKMQAILDAVVEDQLGPEAAKALDEQINAEIAAERAS